MPVDVEILAIAACAGNTCSHAELTRRALQQAAALVGVELRVTETLVTSVAQARAMGFPGSPTVRVAGHDIEPDARPVGALACRRYPGGRSVPPLAMLVAALRSVVPT